MGLPMARLLLLLAVVSGAAAGQPTGEEKWAGSCVSGDCENGHGVWAATAGGQAYEGEWRSGLRHGRGVATSADGSRFSGIFAHGVRHGHGVETDAADGSVYDGAWREGLRHGPGAIDYPDGSRYDGAFEHGRKHGRGIFKGGGSDLSAGLGGHAGGGGGKKYAVQHKAGKKHGRGVLVFPDGSVFNGLFHEGALSGGSDEL